MIKENLCYDKRMNIVTVIPLKRGIGKESLSYFTSEDISPGTIVSVPLRSKNIDAIVLETEDVADKKSEIKDANYNLKKVESVVGPAPFRPSFFESCKRMRLYTANTTGSIIDTLLPDIFLEKYSEIVKFSKIESGEETKVKNEKLIFQALKNDRISWYRTLIRESFAKKQSVFIVVPTEYDIEEFYNALSRGIEQYVFKFHSSITKKNIIKSYNTLVSMEHPVLIVGTGGYLAVPRHDIKTIILEHESSSSYKGAYKPFLDIRSFVEILSEEEKIKLIYGDTLLRPETLHRHDIGELTEVAPPLFRLPQVERVMVVNMAKETEAQGEQKKFSVLSDTTKDMIEYALTHKENVFLFTVRKGLAGITVCHDCGHTILCEDCKIPLVLYGEKQKTATKIARERIFMCNKCGKQKTTETRCTNCESWNLTPLGIGTDRVYEEVRKLYKDANILQIDKETITNDKDMQIASDSFYKNEGSIIIGTELAFSLLREQVVHSAIISFDGLLSIPSFNINQKILHIIEKLHELTKRNLIIQTRMPDTLLLRQVLTGNVLPLFREDLRERKEFDYPPFKRLIKITFRGTAKESEKARAYINEVFSTYEPEIYSAFVGKIRGEYVINTAIKVSPEIWTFPPKDKLKEETSDLFHKLSSLPPSFSVNVDPEDLL